LPVTIAQNNEFPVIVTTQSTIDAKTSFYEQFNASQRMQSKGVWAASFNEMTYTNDANYRISVRPMISIGTTGNSTNTVVAGALFAGRYYSSSGLGNHDWSTGAIVDDGELETIKRALVTILSHTNASPWHFSLSIRDGNLAISDSTSTSEAARIGFGNRNSIALDSIQLQRVIEFISRVQAKTSELKTEAASFKP
jgi:hypothetical protein